MTSRLILPEHYVKEIRPPSEKNTPVVVNFNILVVDINSINVEDMDFRVDMFVSQSWMESRLNMSQDIFEKDDDYVILPTGFFDNLWQPDPYFLNSKVSEIATLSHKFSLVTLYRNKTIKYSARINAIVACQMEFQLYPMDIQICPIYIESFSYNRKKLRLKWGAGGVTVNPELKLLQYDIGKPAVLEETIDYMLEKNGNFSRLVVFFRFERQIGHHLIQTFAPSTLVVMLSWFSFWLGLDAIPGRVALLVTSMLTLVTMFTGLKSDIPPVAYIKALDVWMAGCMMFVFAALGEFVVVKVLDLRHAENDSQSSMGSRSFSRLTAKSIWDDEFTYANKPENKRTSRYLLPTLWLNPKSQIMQSRKTRSQKIDCYSRIVFPILFLLFVVLYWPTVLLKKVP
ncbi:glycine receptor subunit alphaZ1 isoform X3 [Linepithema humile]|nr:PREDICTED: glycine receptor subunit alphaZ1 isoform X3 [Linepithema humile]XP_012232267.1 PREDICTED: glycine receptor subunit alphaZ1 isoform X3 [Linepithema humile]XP_012232275.1 PREDICTED: glycine receptor subunit alphaZ1 isoform X3 [Linepithema humile]XP_012232282.1 PREDICTED: glycine receptor subunit alphaZ1 isoform X3 [Linepithema humile]